MKTLEYGPWIYYLSGKEKVLDEHKCGKWMYFPKSIEKAKDVCSKAVENGACYESKHSKELDDRGLALVCFYLNGDDVENHKRVIQFMLDNNLIPRTKTGKLYNNSFKFDDQTRAGEYGGDFEGKIKLDQFLDLTTGKFLEGI